MSVTTARATADEVEHANATGLTPVVFIHGFWLLPNSWDRWAKANRWRRSWDVVTPWNPTPPLNTPLRQFESGRQRSG